MLIFSSPLPLPWHCTRVQQRVWSLSSLASLSSSDATCASFVPLRVCLWARSSTAWRLSCRQEYASFSSTSFPCVSKERLSRRYRKQKRRGTQIRKSNSTGSMKSWATSTERPRHWEYFPLPVYVAFFVVAFFVAPLGLPSPIHYCLGRCSCDRRLLSSFPPSETRNKRLPRDVALHADVRTLTKDHEAQRKTSKRRETPPSSAEENSKTSNTTLWCSWYRGRVFSLRNRWAWCLPSTSSRPRSEMLLPWKVYPHWDADFCMEDRWSATSS